MQSQTQFGKGYTAALKDIADAFFEQAQAEMKKMEAAHKIMRDPLTTEGKEAAEKAFSDAVRARSAAMDAWQVARKMKQAGPRKAAA